MLITIYLNWFRIPIELFTLLTNFLMVSKILIPNTKIFNPKVMMNVKNYFTIKNTQLMSLKLALHHFIFSHLYIANQSFKIYWKYHYLNLKTNLTKEYTKKLKITKKKLKNSGFMKKNLKTYRLGNYLLCLIILSKYYLVNFR